jgi:hypothetical protein
VLGRDQKCLQNFSPKIERLECRWQNKDKNKFVEEERGNTNWTVGTAAEVES